MEKLPHPFRINFEDGTFGNFVKVEPIPPQRHILESISGMKYGRKNAEAHTVNILVTLMKTHPNIFFSTPEVLQAAESVIIHYHANKRKSILLYDTDRDEYVLYVIDEKNSIRGSAIRITRMLRGIISHLYLQAEEMFVGATFDFKSLLECLDYDMEAAVKTEDYEHAAKVRDVIVGMDKISKELE